TQAVRGQETGTEGFASHDGGIGGASRPAKAAGPASRNYYRSPAVDAGRPEEGRGRGTSGGQDERFAGTPEHDAGPHRDASDDGAPHQGSEGATGGTGNATGR
ncbi:hypothetical protein ACQX7T_14620, partial [Staphylococcus aureus]